MNVLGWYHHRTLVTATKKGKSSCICHRIDWPTGGQDCPDDQGNQGNVATGFQHQGNHVIQHRIGFGFALLLALACRLWKLEGLQAWRLGGLEARRSPSINSGKRVCKPVPKTSSPYVPSFGGEVQSLHCLGLSIVCSPPLVAPFEWAPGSFATQSQGKAIR